MNRNNLCLAGLVVLMIHLMSLSAMAQEDPRLWEADGLAVKQGLHLQWQSTSATNCQGQTCVVWSDTRTGNRDIYAQLILADGTYAWPDGGLPIVTRPALQQDPAVTAVEDGWIIAWVEYIDLEIPNLATTFTAAIYAQKLDSEGNFMWQPNGALVENVGISDEMELQIVPDMEGGALVAWAHWSLIHVQRIIDFGAIGWNGAVALGDPNNYNTNMKAIPDGSGNMLIAWGTIDASDHPNLYGTKVMANGSLPWGNGAGYIPIGTTIDNRRIFRICPDFATNGFYCAWTHENGYNDTDLYLQRVSGDGGVLWDAGGMLLCETLRSKDQVQIAASINSENQDGTICTWTDNRSENNTYEVYAQKVSADGVISWNEDNVLVSGDVQPEFDRYRIDPRIITDYAGGAVIYWDHNQLIGDIGWSCKLYAARLNEAGTQLWTEGGVQITADDAIQCNGVMNLDTTASVIDVVFNSAQTGSNSIRQQRVNFDNGSTLFETEHEIRAGLDGEIEDLRTISMSGDRVGLVWTDCRVRNYSYAIHYQILNAAGEFELPANGIMMAPDSTVSGYIHQSAPALTSDGNGGFLAAFTSRTDFDQIRLTKVDAAGDIACDPAGMLVSASPHDQQTSFICPDGAGGCYVAWLEDDMSFTQNVHIMHCSQNCTPLWQASLLPIGSDTTDHEILGLIPSADCCMLVCENGPPSGRTKHVARICADGSVAWNRLLCDASLVQRDMCVIEDGNGGAYFSWTDARSISYAALFVQHIDSEGNDLWLHNGRRVVQEDAYQSKLAYSAEHGLYLVWEHNSYRSDIYAQKINEDGNPVWDTNGIILCAASSYQGHPQLLLNNMGGFTCIWEDSRYHYFDVYGIDILPNGSVSNSWWIDGEGNSISSAYNDQASPVLAPMGDYRLCVAWIDYRATGFLNYSREGKMGSSLTDVYAQTILVGTASGTNDHHAPVTYEYALDQNYPNPFNPATTISFAIPCAGQTSLIVYDVLGRTVETLMNKQLAAGNYHVQWNAEALPSGVYFYRLTSGNFTDVKKTVLLK